MSSAVRALDRLDWRDDRVLLDGLTLWLQSHPSDKRPDVKSLALYKSRAIIDEYRRVLAARPDFEPEHIFEVGIWDGGSVAFWYEVFRPKALVAIDLTDREDNPQLRRYLARSGAEGAVRTYWRTDQADRERLHELVAELGAPIDLVNRTMLAFYAPTRATFEALFPFLRQGDLYVIEDWPCGQLPRSRRGSPLVQRNTADSPRPRSRRVAGLVPRPRREHGRQLRLRGG